MQFVQRFPGFHQSFARREYPPKVYRQTAQQAGNGHTHEGPQKPEALSRVRGKGEQVIHTDHTMRPQEAGS